MTDVQSIILQRPDVGSGAVRVCIFADDDENVSYIIEDTDGECKMRAYSDWEPYVAADEGLPAEELRDLSQKHFADPVVDAFTITEGSSVWQAIQQAAERLCDKICAYEIEASNDGWWMEDD